MKDETKTRILFWLGIFIIVGFSFWYLTIFIFWTISPFKMLILVFPLPFLFVYVGMMITILMAPGQLKKYLEEFEKLKLQSEANAS